MKEVKIDIRFIDNKTSVGYGPGIWKLDDETADRLIERGQAILTKPTKETEKAKGNPKPETKKSSSDDKDQLGIPKTAASVEPKAQKGIPDDFPEVMTLRDAGYKTIDSLLEADEETLLAIEGIGVGRLNKIAAALEDYQ